ncbi:MAG: hypothetical protein ACE361_09040 [Aureliella sp.]
MKLCKTERALRTAWTKSARRIVFAAAVAGLTSNAVQAQSAGTSGPEAPVTSAPTMQLDAPVRTVTTKKISDQPSAQVALPPALPLQSRVRLASAEADSNDSVPNGEISESLLDLDIPVPGLDMHLKIPAEPASASDMPSASDRSPISREPEIVPRGRKMKIRIEPVRLDEHTGEAIRLPAISHLSDSSASTSAAPAIELSSRSTDTDGIVGGAVELALPPASEISAGDSQALTPEQIASEPPAIQLPTMSLSDSVDYVDATQPPEPTSLMPTESAAASVATNQKMVIEPMSSAPPSPTFSIDDIEPSPPVSSSELSRPVATTKQAVAPLAIAKPAAAVAALPVAASEKPVEDPAVADLSKTPMRVGDAMVLAAQDVAALDADGTIIEYSVEHPTICRLIRTSDTTLSLVGLKEGSTRVAVVTASATGQPQSIEVRSISVRGAAEAMKQPQVFQELSQAIAKLYPQSNVRVQQRGEEIVVTGFAKTEKNARRIVSMVRKTTLTPVVDEVRSATR